MREHAGNGLAENETGQSRITVGELIRDNRSNKAEEARYIWILTRHYKNLKLARICSDARSFSPIPDTSIEVNQIAAGKTAPEPQKTLLESDGVNGKVIMTHFDSETLHPEKMPTGCGGLAAKNEELKNNEIPGDLGYYIKNHVLHPDPVMQAVLSAREIYFQTDKPVLAATQDHRTGKIYPLFVLNSFPGGGGNFGGHKSVLQALEERWYDPQRLYENGAIPAVEDGRVGRHHEDFISACREMESRLAISNPNLFEDSKVQNPELISWSTSSMPTATRLPETRRNPNRVFEIFGPRKKIEAVGAGRLATSVTVDEMELFPSIAQLGYPVGQALENHGQNGKPFSNTNTILIDTENFLLSTLLADDLARNNPNVLEWAQIENHQIIVSETSDGLITRMEHFHI